METMQHVVVVADRPIGVIDPRLHGHFAEHLGELVYPGVYVDPDGAIPNIGGLRKDVIEALKPLEIPVLRWPGGCFADNYHWRDGIGPSSSRPLRINQHWGMAPEPNSFGTHEFVAFSRAIGAAPYFAANVGSGTVEEMAQWIEYCNFAGDSSLAAERQANGAADPFGISLWGIGNENWGCGGRMTPEEYAAAFCRYRSFAFDYSGTKVEAVACGPNGPDWAWTQRFFEAFTSYAGFGRLESANYYAAHYYTWGTGPALEYDDAEWLRTLSVAAAVEGVIIGHRAIMDEFDPERKIGLILDEWGTWHHVEQGKPSSGLYQQSTMRDACVAAITLNTFNSHADKIVAANIAQLINVLQSCILTDGDRLIKTPTYHVFDLFRPHKGAQAVRFVFEGETASDGGAATEHCSNCYTDKRSFELPVVHGSASVKDGMLCVTAVNVHPTSAVEMDLEIQGPSVAEAELVTLTASGDIHAHNTFDSPGVVKLEPPVTVKASDGHLRVPLAPGQIVRLMMPAAG